MDALESEASPVVWLVVWAVASCGFFVGYSSGPGILESLTFRQQFFPEVERGPVVPGVPPPGSVAHPVPAGDVYAARYCISDSRKLGLFFAVKYMAGCVATLPVGFLTRTKGRRLSMWLGCATYALAQLLRGVATNFPTLVAAQILDGISIAFMYQAPYIEAVEVAPHRWRGRFVYSDQVGRSVGVWARSLLVQGLSMQDHSPTWGWRVAALFPIWPAIVVLLLMPLIPETPNSLIQRGNLEAGRAALQEIRGPLQDVDDEFEGILRAAGIRRLTSGAEVPLIQVAALRHRSQAAPLIVVLLLSILRECTGGDFVLLHAASFSKALGAMGPYNGFLARQVFNTVYFATSLASLLVVDRSRRALLASSAAGTALGCTLLAVVLHVYFGAASAAPVNPKAPFMLHLALITTYGSYAFGLSGGYWLAVAELFPLSSRSLATSLFAGLTMALYAITSSMALDWLCRLRSRLVILYACLGVVTVVFVVLLMPETSGVPLEDVHLTFKRHWLWRRLYAPPPSIALSPLPTAPPAHALQGPPWPGGGGGGHSGGGGGSEASASKQRPGRPPGAGSSGAQGPSDPGALQDGAQAQRPGRGWLSWGRRNSGDSLGAWPSGEVYLSQLDAR